MTSGWHRTELANVARVSTGPFGSLLHKSDYTSHGIPLLNPINIRDGRIVPDSEKLLSEATVRRLSTYTLEDGDVVVGRRGEIGRCAVITHHEAGWICGTGSFFVRPSSSINSHFLAYLLRSSGGREKLEAASTGATMNNLSNQALSGFIIPVPSIRVQNRIVAILDEAIEGIDAAVVNTEKNLVNARELFDNCLNFVFTQKDKGWAETTLEHVLTEQPRNGWSPPAENHANSGVPVLTLSSVTGFQFRPNKIKFTSAKADAGRHYWVRNGDFLITRSNTPELVGHVAIADGITRPTIYPDLIMRMIPAPDRMLTRFLYYQMRRCRCAGKSQAERKVRTRQ
jgi:type I restriction enzyme, S subunit